MEKTFKFNCDQCKFRCNLAWQLKDHMKKKHENKPKATEETEEKKLTPSVSFVKLPEIYPVPKEEEEEEETTDDEEEDKFNESRLKDIKRQTPGTALNKTKSKIKKIEEKVETEMWICEGC